MTRRHLEVPLSRRAFGTGIGAMAWSCTEGFHPRYPDPTKCGQSCTVVDVHCHVFNGSDLPIKAFITQILPLPKRWTSSAAKELHALINKYAPSGQEELGAIAQKLADNERVTAPTNLSLPAPLQSLIGQMWRRVSWSESFDRGVFDRFSKALALTTRPRHEVAATVVQAYPTVDLFTPLLVDYDYLSENPSDTPETRLLKQLEVHSQLSILSMKGLLGRPEARLHSFAPYNPMREYREVIENGGAGYAPQVSLAPLASIPGDTAGALDPLRYAVQQLGFIGVKLYPNSGYLPLLNTARQTPPDADSQQYARVMAGLDQALCALYAYCENTDLPLTTHASGGNQYELGFEIFAEPKNWEPVLKRYPKLRLNLGHFGHLRGLEEGDERGLRACESWMRQAADLIQRYDNVYVDMANSPVLHEERYQDRFFETLKQVVSRYPKAQLRIMYGSDWWMNTLDPNHEDAVRAFEHQLSQHLARDQRNIMGNNALRFLGFIDDSGQPLRTNQNRRRLRDFYDGKGVTPPHWLADS